MSVVYNLLGSTAASNNIIANDSAQTLGTYIGGVLASDKEGENAKKKKFQRTLAAVPILGTFAYTMAEGIMADDLTFGRSLKNLDIDSIRAEGNDAKDISAC